MMDLNDGVAAVVELVHRFETNRASYVSSSSSYNETQLRTEFLNPFLQALGWDVFNERNAPQHRREVVQEASVQVGEEDEISAKRPDYALRQGPERRFFVEAKKPSLEVAAHGASAFQVRRYGWSAGMAVSVLTNFDKLILYDCRPRPEADQAAHYARLKVYDYTEYVDEFEELYWQLSREAVYSGRFDEIFGVGEEPEGTEAFDEYFLGQIENWRVELAQDLAERNPQLDEDDLDFIVERLIDRIIFLRICEDRSIERYRRLTEVDTYEDLKATFKEAEKKYDSGLFDFIEDQLSLDVDVGTGLVTQVIQQLYYPESPYAFSVVEAGILGQIYERFLARKIVINEGREAELVEKPEVVASRGVVPTPDCIVRRIVNHTLTPMCEGKSPAELSDLRVADIACGSGAFLLAAYEYLHNHHLDWYLNDGAEKHSDLVYERPEGEWHLTLLEKRRILVDHIFGVDIDDQATDITRFGLVVKLLEDETAESTDGYCEQYGAPVLPNLSNNIKCGNSLVDGDYFDFDSAALTLSEDFIRINPMDWEEAFTEVWEEGGFDAIVGNPPYVRIQNMVEYSPREVDFYESELSPYECAQRDNFDKYALFIERALSLLKESGRLGYIVPHKFFTIKSGRCLRRILSSGDHVAGIVHFGVQPVFGKQRANYTCILQVTKEPTAEFTVEHVGDFQSWCRGQTGVQEHYLVEEMSEEPWEFVSAEKRELFGRLREANPVKLEDVADIFVGVQTSADAIYIFEPVEELDQTVRFMDPDGNSWEIEKSILRACLLDVELPAFGHPKANALMIFPYEIAEGKARVYAQEEMESDFPRCWEYLCAHEEQLRDRSISPYTPGTWYRFGRSQSLTKFNGEPKLIWPVLSLEPRYAYDDRDILFTGGGNGPYYGLRPRAEGQLSIFYLQAVLSHPVVESMVRARGSAFQGDYRSHGKQFMKDLPIPEIDFSDAEETVVHDRIAELVECLIDAVEKKSGAKLPEERRVFARQVEELRRRVEALVGQLYDLDEDDLEAVAEQRED